MRSLSGVVLEESHEARQTKLLSKGGLAKDLEAGSDREDIAGGSIGSK